ncbi:hypothetical protein ACFVVM_31160 [Nocardia sp. NPDC058176]|uniref:hypothetical protein n=1 Tax=Nocardia sp. NPDC058176 TaxID=3346368 RepID=UPI0036DAE7D5
MATTRYRVGENMIDSTGIRASLRLAGLSLVVGVVAACGGSTVPIDPIDALPPLSEFPAGYRLIGEPREYDGTEKVDVPGLDLDVRYTDESCRVLIDTPIGAGAGESVSSVHRAVYLVQVTAADLDPAELGSAVDRCATVEGESSNYSLHMAITKIDSPGADTVGFRASGVQTVRSPSGTLTETVVVQDRLVGRVGEYVLTAAVSLNPITGTTVTDDEIAAESPVLRSIFDQTMRRLSGETE